MVRIGARVPGRDKVCMGRLTMDLALTESPRGTSFILFRGHLSRPACSHVKQLAKQAGDRSDPGRTFVQAGFFSAWFPWCLQLPEGDRYQDGKSAVDTKSGDPRRRAFA